MKNDIIKKDNILKLFSLKVIDDLDYYLVYDTYKTVAASKEEAIEKILKNKKNIKRSHIHCVDIEKYI